MKTKKRSLHRQITLEEATGRRIHHVYDVDGGWKRYPSDSRVPGPDKLANYELEFAGRQLLVLDDYGADRIPDAVHRRIFKEPYGVSTIGIYYPSGLVCNVSYGREDGQTIAVVGTFLPHLPEPYVVPRHALARISQLRSMKRPYYLSVRSESLMGLIERETGYSDIPGNIVVGLSFHKVGLEVWGRDYRFVSGWGNPDRKETLGSLF